MLGSPGETMNEFREVFRDNVVVLTGASRGIGRELALQLAGQGARLALSARDAAALDELAEICRARGGQAVAIPADVGEEAQCAELIRRTVETYGRIDTLINNAGISMWALFDQVTDLSIFETLMTHRAQGDRRRALISKRM